MLSVAIRTLKETVVPGGNRLTGIKQSLRLPLRLSVLWLTTSALLMSSLGAHAAVNCAGFSGSINGNGPANKPVSLVPGDVVHLTYTFGFGNTWYAPGNVAVFVNDQTSRDITIQPNQGGIYSLYVNINTIASWSCTPAGQQQQQQPPPPPQSTNAPSPTVSHKIIAKQIGTRVQTTVTNTMGSSRQIDRLMDQGSSSQVDITLAPGANAGFTADEKRALDVAANSAASPRLGLGMSGASSANAPLASQLGLRSTYDDDITSPLRTRGPNYGNEGGGGMSVAGLNLFGSGDGGAYNFSTSLRDITRSAQAQEDARLKDDPTAAAMGFTASRGRSLDKRANPLDVWVEGRFLRLNDSRNGADLSGYSGLFGTGVDYVFNKTLLAGVSLSYDVSGQKSSANATEARGTGWLLGPYATVRLSDQVFWQSRAAWGKASNDVSPNLTVTDSFGSTRWLVSSKLTGRYQMGAWQLRPSAGVAYMEETSDGYRSGTGTNVDSIKTRVGTASAGPEISYQYRMSPNVLIEPRAGIEAIWTFARDISVGGNSALVAGDAIGPEGTRGRAELGLRTMIVGGTVLDISGAYDGIGAGDYNTVTGRAVVRVPLN